MDSPADLLRKARIAHGFKSAAAAARKHGWKSPTYTSHENGNRPISRKAAKLYAAAYNISERALMGIRGHDEGAELAANVLVVGEAAMGTWLDTAVVERKQEQPKALSVPGRARRIAVRVTDESANLSILPGEYAIVEPLERGHGELKNGALVLINRKRGTLLERSIRRVELRSDGKLRLVTHSNLTRLAEALTYPSPKTADEIVLVGQVVGKYVEFE